MSALLRRPLLGLIALAALVVWHGPAPSNAAPAGDGSSDIPVSGVPVPELAAFDQVMTRLMAKWEIPGGQLAIAKDGRLVFNHAYGYGDVEQAQPVQTDSLFRIASVTKPFTGVAILKLIQDGKLTLDDKAFRVLGALQPPAGAEVDPRLYDITIQNLLQHTGGWDGSTGVEPMAPPFSLMAAQSLGVPNPPSCESIIRWMMGVPLDFTPGTRYAYSNFGYCVLGRVIEAVSGMSYEAYVKTQVLAPLGITDMRIAGTLLSERALGEVKYYPPPGAVPFVSVYPGEGFVSLPYGAYYLRGMEAHGGWIATAADLVRFTLGIDGQRPPALLNPEMVRAMLYTPVPQSDTAVSSGAGNEAGGYGLTWIVQLTDTGPVMSHAGALIGSTMAFMVRRPDGVTLAFTFNSQPEDGGAVFAEAIAALLAAVQEVRGWPAGDQFTR
jgi:CubicO group peptidase (beta-lactamase class C family)